MIALSKSEWYLQVCNINKNYGITKHFQTWKPNLWYALKISRYSRVTEHCRGSDIFNWSIIILLPWTVPQGYCLAFTILFPILTSSLLPTTAKGTCPCQNKRRNHWYNSSQRPQHEHLIGGSLVSCSLTFMTLLASATVSSSIGKL